MLFWRENRYCNSKKIQIMITNSSITSAISSPVILTCEVYTFKPLPMDCAFIYDIHCMWWILSFKIFVDHIKRWHGWNPHPRQCSPKVEITGYNIRDFGQLLNNLHSQFRHLACEREKVYKKFNFIFNKICLQKICCLNTHTHTHTLYIYIYIYIYIYKFLLYVQREEEIF